MSRETDLEVLLQAAKDVWRAFYRYRISPPFEKVLRDAIETLKESIDLVEKPIPHCDKERCHHFFKTTDGDCPWCYHPGGPYKVDVTEYAANRIEELERVLNRVLALEPYGSLLSIQKNIVDVLDKMERVGVTLRKAVKP
jgi:DNA-binding helix-hairpin-helix protein with protein kinase domain